jgi:hypothetical protein
MADELDIPEIDADPRLRLLTDALRAGPGTPEWTAAVAEARTLGAAPGADEYAVLMAARERLADGRAYRSVRAGPGFGRRIMARVDAADTTQTRSPLSAGLLAYVGVGLAVGVLGLLVALVVRSTSGEGTGQQELAQAYFPTTFASATLTGPLMQGYFNPIGSLSLDATNGLALAADVKVPGDGYAGGGLVTRKGAPADEPLAVQATFHFGHTGPGCVPQLFIADSPDFTPDRGVSPHELVWLVQGDQGQVAVADGSVKDPRLKVHGGDEVAVKLVVAPGGDAAVVCNGTVLWTGASGLADKPRYAGVRMLYRPDGRRDAVTVRNLKVMQK